MKVIFLFFGKCNKCIHIRESGQNHWNQNKKVKSGKIQCMHESGLIDGISQVSGPFQCNSSLIM